MRKLIAAPLLYLALVGAASATGEPQVSTITNTPTYAAASNFANTGAGDIACIYGSATKTIFITEVHFTAAANAAITIVENTVRRSSVGTGGTGASPTLVAYNTDNPAPTASVTFYTVSPTPGTLVAIIDNHFYGIVAQGGQPQEIELNFGNHSDQPLTLRGTSQGFCINVTAGGAGTQYALHIRWMEQ